MTLPPFTEFWEANQIVEMPESEQNAKFVRFADFRRDPENHPLKTESGKIVIYSERIASFGYADCPPHPTWLEPDEWHGNALPISCRYYLPIPRTVCTASLTIPPCASSMRSPAESPSR